MKLSSSRSKSPSRYNKNTHRTKNTRARQNTRGAANTYSTSNTQKKPSVVLSAIFGVSAFFSISFFIALLIVRSFGVGHIVRNTDVLSILENFSTGEHAYYIVDQVNGLPFTETQFYLHSIAGFLQHEKVTDELERIVEGYATALMFGNPDHHITVDDVMISARNLEPVLNAFFSHEMTDDDYNILVHTLNDILDFETLSLEGIIEDLDMDMSPLPLILLSPVLLWVVGLFSAGLLLVLFLLRKRNIATAILSVGIPIAASGLILFGAGTFVRVNLVAANGEPIGFSRFLEDPVHLFAQIGLITTIVGVVIIAASFVVRFTRRPSTTPSF